MMDEADAPKVSAERGEAAPVKPRPKLTLLEQSAFLSGLLARCVMHTGPNKGVYAGDALLALTSDDMLKIEAIQQTIAFFDAHDVGRLGRQEMAKRYRK